MMKFVALFCLSVTCILVSVVPASSQLPDNCVDFGKVPHFVGELPVSNEILRIDATDNDLAYQCIDGIYWCDVSSGGVPDVIGYYPFAEDNSQGLLFKIRGETVAYFRPEAEPNTGQVLEIVDFSVPDSPVVTSTAVLAAVGAAKIVGNLAFISVAGQGLTIYDISTPSAPVITGQILPSRSIGSFSVDGDYCWVTYNNYLQAFGIADPSSPVLLFTEELYSGSGEKFRGVVVKDGVGAVKRAVPDYWGISWEYYWSGIYTNNYTEFDLVAMDAVGSIYDLAVDDGCLFYHDGPSIVVQSYEGNDGFRVRHILDTTGSVSGIPHLLVHNGRAWAAESGFVRMYEGDWHAEPAVEYRHRVAGSEVHLLAVNGEKAFLRATTYYDGASNDCRVAVFDVEDLSSPVHEIDISIDPDWSWGSTLLIHGDYIYRGNWPVYETTSVVHWPTGTDLGEVCLGNYCNLYPANDPIIYGFGSYCGDGVQIYDLTDPVVPVFVGSTLTNFDFSIMSAHDDVLYCQGTESGSYDREWIVIDVSDATAPAVVGRGPANYTVKSIEQTDALMLVACSDGLRIFDRDAAAVPTLVNHLECGVVNGICVSDYILYLDTGMGYTLVDIADPAYPVVRGNYSAWTSLDGMAIHGERLLCCEECVPRDDYSSLTVGLLWCNDPLGTEDHTEDPLPEPTPLKLLAQPYPNPFNPQTTINFSLARSEQASISIFDVAGRLVAVLADQTFEAGEHSLVWNGRDRSGREMPSGSYVVRMETASTTSTRKMALVR